MFTGLIQTIGTIAAIDRLGDWTVTIATPHPLTDLAQGASIACNGICLTVIEVREDGFKVQISAETLKKTTASRWNIATRLNLERSLRMGEEVGGHLLAGHVDGIARVMDKKREDDSVRYQFEVPPEFARYLAPKGSVALDGISLTVNEVEGARFGVNIIPHTRLMTTIGERMPGDVVNFEADMIARYLDRLMQERNM
jgi:riboflavin synthase